MTDNDIIKYCDNIVLLLAQIITLFLLQLAIDRNPIAGILTFGIVLALINGIILWKMWHGTKFL
jgi:hypothetical protein